MQQSKIHKTKNSFPKKTTYLFSFSRAAFPFSSISSLTDNNKRFGARDFFPLIVCVRLLVHFTFLYFCEKKNLFSSFPRTNQFEFQMEIWDVTKSAAVLIGFLWRCTSGRVESFSWLSLELFYTLVAFFLSI